MSKKIFRSVIAVAITVLLVSLVFTSAFLYDYYTKYQASRLKEELSLAAVGVEKAGAEYLYDFSSDVFRFTLVSPKGNVLYDSKMQNEKMENHIDREEIRAAFEKGSGSSTRYSQTLTQRTFYEALLLSNGNVLRISTTQVTMATLMLGMLPAICVIILFSVIITVLLSKRTAKSIVKPLEALDLENPESNDTYEELTPLLIKLGRQRRQISSQMRELNRRSEEFKQITSSMNEGLVLLDSGGKILSINAAAERLFGADDTCLGQDFLTLDRSTAVSHAIKKALDGKRAELREERNGREYQFVISRTEADRASAGVVILFFDVTEAALAERSRSEFTANVSHELKTPLQSIIGSAELLENGLVKKEDTAKFVGNIKTEATRLVSLINDIIRLSQLDEGGEPAREAVDMYAVADEALAALKDSAAKRQVSLCLKGEPCIVEGIHRYLYEIVYNLCDNAIRYNRAGGSVEVELKRVNGSTLLSVTDTGIGIPAEHQPRIFERFYRVDKSHSKETGGTGLGLSIVKHAVAYHGGTIKLESRVGEGTCVTVEL